MIGERPSLMRIECRVRTATLPGVETMSCKQMVALAVLAFQKGNKDECLQYMAKAGEFGDDLTQFVSEVMQPAPTAVRNDGSTPQAENTLAPSLAANASAENFVHLTNRLSRQLATASFLDEDEELDAFPSDDALDDLEYELEDDVNGLDEDSEDEDDSDDEEAVASAGLAECGPIRYKS